MLRRWMAGAFEGNRDADLVPWRHRYRLSNQVIVARVSRALSRNVQLDVTQCAITFAGNHGKTQLAAHPQHGRIFSEYRTVKVPDACCFCVVDQMTHQGPAQAMSFQIGAHQYRILGPLPVGIG